MVCGIYRDTGNRYKLAKRLGIFLVVGSTLYTLLVIYYMLFLKK